SIIKLVDAEGFTSMLVLKLSVANILHAPESIDPTSAETWIQAVQSPIFRLSSFHSCKLKLDVMKQAPPLPGVDKLTVPTVMRLKGGAMERIYIGGDLHARQQTICYQTTVDGEVRTH